MAAELPAGTREAIDRFAGELRASLATDALRWVPSDGRHLTLQFLGWVPASQLRELRIALHEGLRDQPAFNLRPAATGSFGGRTRMRVLWLGLDGELAALQEAAARTVRALAPLGFAPDHEAFRPHLTLARVRDQASREERARLHDALARTPAPVIPPFRVAAISLMRSQPGREGAVYSALATFQLAER